MKKIYLLVLSLLFAGGVVYSQTPDSWSDNFDDNDINPAWGINPGIFELVEANGELTMTITKQGPWDGIHLKFPDKIDLSANPYASFRLKADSAVDFRIYLWDENETDTLYNRSNADVWVVPGDTYYTYYFNWRGKFKHISEEDNPDMEATLLDSTDIEGFLINVDPGNDEPLYQGDIIIDDVMVGSVAELPTAEAMITASAIGAVGATSISDIPEGTSVQNLMDGITHNGDDLILLAAGNDGKAGIEAAGTDILDPAMDLVVFLAGSNPKKYNIVVAPPALPCYYRADFPSVDGEIDAVWETVPIVDVSHILPGGVVDGPTDFGATFRVLWDEVSLFILAEVTDDIEMLDSPQEPYNDDCVEFWLDLNNSKNSSYLPSETDEFQFMFPRGGDTYRLDHHDRVDGMDWAWASSQGGYIFEIEVPWLTSLEWLDRFETTQPAIGQKIGFDLHVNDDDDGDAREATLSWFDIDNMAWTDPSVLGDLQMKDEIYESVGLHGSDLHFRIYPNPASETLQLISNQGISHIEVFNMAGQSVMSRNVSNERLVDLDITVLPNSIYLVRVDNQQGISTTRKLIKR
ncbi:MAG: sugar-binding protein [Bacteroidota bacterium]